VTLLVRGYYTLLRFAFRLLYNEMAWSYDWVSRAVSWGNWRTWGRAALAHTAGPRVLEIAFGTGDILLDLHASGFETYGLDISPYMIEIARRKLKRAGIHAPLVRGRAQELPFISGFFDSIVITFPTSFVLQQSTLDELVRVLRPGGRLVIVDRASLRRPKLAARLIGWLYAITGQSYQGDSSEVDWFKRCGWQAVEYEQHLASSVVHLFVLQPIRSSSEALPFP